MPQRMAMPAMQFFSGEQKGIPKGWKKVASESRPGEFSFLNLKTGKKYDKLPATGGNFYDDERDTTAKPAWNPFAAEEAKAKMEFRSDAEAAGFSEDGSDLANDGGALYAFFTPFLMLTIAYSTGLFSFGYDKGNF